MARRCASRLLSMLAVTALVLGAWLASAPATFVPPSPLRASIAPTTPLCRNPSEVVVRSRGGASDEASSDVQVENSWVNYLLIALGTLVALVLAGLVYEDWIPCMVKDSKLGEPPQSYIPACTALSFGVLVIESGLQVVLFVSKFTGGQPAA
mmetsp:Transcript_132385/g.283089  ORF Transcript_132385/g.283089 Transcript_132385/m.283089 type:complete len:152 (+) Transcript_132385:66-521(+)